MAEITFFVSWALWQQMTFVLGCLIALVFVAGLIKLWFKNRLLKKHTVLDEEKRARQQEMRNSGLPVGRKVDIPFGVRAIQSGIQVDGIWISRPGTPIESETPVVAATPLFVGGSDLKGKERASATLGGLQQTPTQSPVLSQEPSMVEHYNPTDSTSAAPAGQQQTYRPRHAPSRPSDPAVRTAAPTRQPALQTYVPTSSYTMEQSSSVDRNSPTSDDNEHQWSSHPAPRHHTRSFSQPRNGPPSPTEHQGRSRYHPAERDHKRNPFESGDSDRAPSRESHSLVDNHNQSYGATDAYIMPPQRTYSGETHANTSSRRVNAGFQVLPAGTFGASDSQDQSENDAPTRSQNRMSVSNKLQKRGRD